MRKKLKHVVTQQALKLCDTGAKVEIPRARTK